jgi:HPt (histidine-containing phosphotransfer) domain-containing protein
MLNQELALERVAGDRELLQEVARLFLDDAERAMGQIEAAIRNQDAKLLDREAHSLKGSVANFGAEEVVKAALALEQMGKRGDFGQAKPGFARLRQLMADLVPELASLSNY